MWPTHIRQGNLLYSFYQPYVNLFQKQTPTPPQTHPDVWPNYLGTPWPSRVDTKLTITSSKLHLFPLLTPLIQESTGIHGQSDRDGCVGDWTIWRALLFWVSKLEIFCYLVYKLEKYSQIWNILPQKMKRDTKPCAFFVVGDARCNNFFLCGRMDP